MIHRLVPHFILDHYQVGKYHGSFKGVGLLADITGFATMTDSLSQHGMHGSEVLASIMRQVFDPMIQSVFEYRGFVVGFAGDAITALFPLEQSADKAYASAVAAALSIQEHFLNHPTFDTPYGPFPIAVKIGLGAGEAHWRIFVAKNGKRATYYFRGSAIDQAISSLKQSGSNEIILSEELYKVQSGMIRGVSKENCYLLQNYTGKLPDRIAVTLPPPDLDHLKVFCSKELSSHDLAGEFRPAVNLFIGIPPTIDRDKKLESFIQNVFSLQDLYGGLFSRVDVGDKGISLLMFWGAPIAQENDVERALNFFLELLREGGVPLTAGITYRLAFAGYIGGILQEEYTCYGWGVSLSARLMVGADSGEIWADGEIARRASLRFSFHHIGKQKFKGFSKEQDVFKLLKRKEDDRAVFNGEFVGRKSELETLSKFVGPIWSGQFAGMLTVIGEPGIGKSRLIDAFRASDLFTGHNVYWALCQTDEIIRQSLNPVRYWLKRYFNVIESNNEAERKQAFAEKLDQLIASISDTDLPRKLDQLRSFLGHLVNLHWSDSVYEKLDAQGKYDSTFLALTVLLRAESLRQPLILLFEDAHLLDSDTEAFLPTLDRTLTADSDKTYPIAILATARPGGVRVKFEHASSDEIILGELTGANLTHLVENHLDGEVAPTLLEIFMQRTEGNPFFAEQILHYLLDENKLERGKIGWQITDQESSAELPTDINAILIARLDRLSREVREVIQTAAVIGREFELRLLSRMLREDDLLTEKVSIGVEAEILSVLTEIRYIFRHALLQDAAYNMQLETRKQQLHRIAVEAYESLYQDQLSLRAQEIAFHADRAGLPDKAKSYYIQAGEVAANAYQNSQAIENYTHALALTSLENIQERIDLLLARVALFRIVGDQTGQEQDLATLELLADKQSNERNRALVALRQSEFALDAGNFQESQHIAEYALSIAELAHEMDVVANAYRYLPLSMARQGKTEQAIQTAQVAIKFVQKAGDRIGEGQLYNDLGLIMLEKKEVDEARKYFEHSLLIAQETAMRRLEAQVHNNLGNIMGMIEYDYAAAKSYFAKTLEIVREIGNRIGEGYALGNLGWASYMLGDFDRAYLYFLDRLKIARETGSHYLEAFGLLNLGASIITQGLYSEAIGYLNQALLIAQKIQDGSLAAWAYTFLGYAYLGLVNFSNATDRFQSALELRQSLGHHNLSMEPIAGLGQAELTKGNPSTALVYVEKILSHLSAGGTLEGTEEPLRIYLTMYQTLLKNGDPRAYRILKDAHALLRKQIAKIQEQSEKEMFLNNIPWRRQIEELWQANKAQKHKNVDS